MTCFSLVAMSVMEGKEDIFAEAKEKTLKTFLVIKGYKLYFLSMKCEHIRRLKQ